MASKKEPTFVTFHCWKCDKRHDFLRGDEVHVRIGVHLKKFPKSKVYKWKGVGCSAYYEDYDPNKMKE